MAELNSSTNFNIIIIIIYFHYTIYNNYLKHNVFIFHDYNLHNSSLHYYKHRSKQKAIVNQ